MIDPTPKQIEAARGHFFIKPTSPFKEPVFRVLCALNPAEQARVAANKALVCEHMPEMVPIIRELHEAGMIDGWRSVGKVRLNPSPPGLPNPLQPPLVPARSTPVGSPLLRNDPSAVRGGAVEDKILKGENAATR
jgi:hypothetical protein